jgi:hypothetical protein
MDFHWSMLIGGAGAAGLFLFVVIIIRRAFEGPPPTALTTRQKRDRQSVVLVLLPLSLMFLVIAVIIYVVVRPVEISSAQRDETVRVFLDAVRRDDAPLLATVVAAGFQPDTPFLREHVRGNDRYEQGSSYISSGDKASCVRGMLFPKRTQVVLALIKVDGHWRVLRAANTDPCEADMRF